MGEVFFVGSENTLLGVVCGVLESCTGDTTVGGVFGVA